MFSIFSSKVVRYKVTQMAASFILLGLIAINHTAIAGEGYDQQEKPQTSSKNDHTVVINIHNNPPQCIQNQYIPPQLPKNGLFNQVWSIASKHKYTIGALCLAGLYYYMIPSAYSAPATNHVIYNINNTFNVTYVINNHINISGSNNVITFNNNIDTAVGNYTIKAIENPMPQHSDLLLTKPSHFPPAVVFLLGYLWSKIYTR